MVLENYTQSWMLDAQGSSAYKYQYRCPVHNNAEEHNQTLGQIAYVNRVAIYNTTIMVM